MLLTTQSVFLMRKTGPAKGPAPRSPARPPAACEVCVPRFPWAAIPGHPAATWRHSLPAGLWASLVPAPGLSLSGLEKEGVPFPLPVIGWKVCIGPDVQGPVKVGARSWALGRSAELTSTPAPQLRG